MATMKTTCNWKAIQTTNEMVKMISNNSNKNNISFVVKMTKKGEMGKSTVFYCILQ